MTVPNLKPKQCEKCGREYPPKNGRQRYCSDCSPNIGGRYDKDKRREVYVSKPRARTAIDLRVEMLGQLNDEHKRLVAAKDRDGLLKLADEYMKLKHPCTVMARAIKMQAESIQ